MSSAGLVYVHFGQDIVAQVLQLPVDSEVVQETYKKVYEGFIEEIVIKILLLSLVNLCISVFLFLFERMQLIMAFPLMMGQLVTK